MGGGPGQMGGGPGQWAAGRASGRRGGPMGGGAGEIRAADDRGQPPSQDQPAGPDQPPDLARRMEQNLAEHSSHLHRGTPGMSVQQTADLLIADCGLDDDSVNFVGAARFTAATARARIAETIAAVEATGRPFAWRVGPTSTPANLRALLADAGLPATEVEPAMWAPLPDADLTGAGLIGADPPATRWKAAGPAAVCLGTGGLDVRLVSSAG